MSKFADDVDLDEEFPVGRDGDAGRRPAREPEDYPELAEDSRQDEYRESRRREVGERPRRRGPDMERAPRPRDHEAPERDPDEVALPVMDEALGIEVIQVSHDGMVLTIPADPEDWPIQATLAFEQGKVITAIRGLLTAEDFAKIMGKNYRNKDFGELYKKFAKAGGFESAGN